MVRVMCTGQMMEAKEMKALTAVLEESRVAVKAVKSVTVHPLPPLFIFLIIFISISSILLLLIII